MSVMCDNSCQFEAPRILGWGVQLSEAPDLPFVRLWNVIFVVDYLSVLGILL